MTTLLDHDDQDHSRTIRSLKISAEELIKVLAEAVKPRMDVLAVEHHQVLPQAVYLHAAPR